MKALRDLAEKWRSKTYADSMTHDSRQKMLKCADDLEAALDACPTLDVLVKEFRDEFHQEVDDPWDDFLAGYRNALGHAADRIEAALPAAPAWRPMSQEGHKSGETTNYVFYFPPTNGCPALYRASRVYGQREPTHWMPLPEPPANPQPESKDDE